MSDPSPLLDRGESVLDTLKLLLFQLNETLNCFGGIQSYRAIVSKKIGRRNLLQRVQKSDDGGAVFGF